MKEKSLVSQKLENFKNNEMENLKLNKFPSEKYTWLEKLKPCTKNTTIKDKILNSLNISQHFIPKVFPDNSIYILKDIQKGIYIFYI